MPEEPLTVAPARAPWRKIFITGGVQAYVVATGAAMVVLTARWLGPEGRGIMAAVVSWASTLSAFLHLSLGQVVVHQAAAARDRDWLGPAVMSLVAVSTLLTLAAWAVAGGLFMATSGSAFGGLQSVAVSLGFLLLPLLIWEQYATCLLVSTGNLNQSNRAIVLGRSATVTFALVAWWLNLGVVACLVVMVVGHCVTVTSAMLGLWRTGQVQPRWEWASLRSLLVGGAKLHWNTVGDSVVWSTSVLVVHHYLGATQTGFYQTAQQIVLVFLAVPTAAGLVFYEGVAQLGLGRAWLQQRRAVLAIVVAMGLAATVTAAVSPLVIPAILGVRFDGSVPILLALLAAVPFLTLAKCVTPQWIARGWFSALSGVRVVLGGIVLGGCFLLVPRFGALGAAWSLAGGAFLAAFAHGWLVLQCEKDSRLHPDVATASTGGSRGS